MHLSQEHDWATRRHLLVDRHVDWIERHFLEPESRVLDLGCGPGFYTHRLAKRGHDCVGLDFSPASIAHAKEQAGKEGLSVTYRQEDVRDVEYGEGFDLVMMIFGEINVFRRKVVEEILNKSRDSLKQGGRILVECHTFKEVKRQGEMPPLWRAAESGLFADHPHLWLEEHFWHADCAAATTRYLIVDTRNGSVTRYASTMQAYTDEQYGSMLTEAGFSDIRGFQAMGEAGPEFAGKLQIFSGRKDTE